VQLGEIALREQKYDEAERIAGQILKDRPKEPQALTLQARVLLARKDAEKAVQLLEAAQKLEPNIPAFQYWKGVAYRQQGNLDLAQHSFEQAIGLNERYTDARVALSQLALDRGLSDVALRYAQQALAQDPKRADALLLAGSAHANLKDVGKAEEEFHQFLALRPGSAEGPMRLGLVYLMQNRFDAAEKEFEKSLTLDPRQVQAVVGLVTLYRLKGQNDKAIARIRRQIEHGETPELDNLLGQTYTQLRQFQPAEEALKRALQLNPQDFNTYVLLGRLYQQENAVDKAVGGFEAATRLNPKSVGAWTALGILREKNGQMEDAEKAYQEALELDPNAAVPANNLAWLYCEHGGDMDKAVELARRAKQALPKAATVSDTLGWIYYKRQLYDSAIPLIQEAVRQEPNKASYRFHLAASLQGAGKKAQARQELDAALKLDAGLRKDEDYQRIFGNL